MISQGKRKRDEVAVVAEEQTGAIQQQLQEERFWQGRAECRKRCRRDEEWAVIRLKKNMKKNL